MYKEEKKKQRPQNTCCVSFFLPWQSYALLQDCQLEFSCAKQLSSTVREFAVALLCAAFEEFLFTLTSPLSVLPPLPNNAAQGIIFRGPWQVILKDFCLNYLWEHECSVTMVRTFHLSEYRSVVGRSVPRFTSKIVPGSEICSFILN